MADIRTPEGREELRRQRDLFITAGYPENVDIAFMFLHVSEKALPHALDGLDIAQEIVGWLKGDETDRNVWLADLVRKWDNWQRG